MINLLHILMIFNFIIGILLLIISFSIYSKLTENCSSKDIRDKLKISIIIASVLVSISVGYGLCISRDACHCDFGKKSNAKINTILLFLIALGSTLLWLNYGIKNDLNKPGCNISVGSLPNILIGICFVQVVVPSLYLISLITKLYDDSDGKSDEGDDGDYGDYGDDDEKEMVELKENLRKRERLVKKDLSKTRTELSKSREKVEALKRKKKKPSSDLVAKINKLQKTESSIKDSLQSIRSELSEADASGSGSGSGSSSSGSGSLGGLVG